MHPDHPDRVESFRLRQYGVFYSHSARQLNAYADAHPAADGLPSVHLPRLHARLLALLSGEALTDAVALLAVVAEHDGPRGVRVRVCTCAWLPCRSPCLCCVVLCCVRTQAHVCACAC